MGNLLNRSPLLIFFLFTVVGAAVYANSLDVPFYLDDLRNISENTNVRINTLSPSSLYSAAFNSPLETRPVANVSFALNYYFNQFNVFEYHLVNIAIHILTSFLLYLLFKATLATPALSSKYSQASSMALFGALLFLVHPLHTGSVTYIVQRMVSMAALFYILSLLFYVQGRKTASRSFTSGWIWFFCSLISFLLAIGSKEIALTLPFVIFLYEWYFFQDLDRRWLYRHAWIAGIMLLVFAIVFVIAGGSQELILDGYKNRSFTPGERVLTQFRVVLFYASLLLFPHPGRLNLDHYFSVSHSLFDPITTFSAAIILVLLLCFSVFCAKKQRVLSFSILWYLGNLVMESSVIGLELVFEHRTYLPSVFLLFTLVVLLFQHVRPGWLVCVIFVFVAGIWSYWTVERNEMWRDPVVFWSDSTKKSPQKARPFMNLSVSLRSKGDIDAAIAASKRAIAIDPRFVNGFVGLAAAYDAKGELEKAAAQYNKAIQMLPDYSEVYNALGVVYLKQGKMNEAAEAFNESLRLNPGDVSTLVNRATFKVYQSNYEHAIDDYNLALKIGGANPDILFNLALAYLKSGQTENAFAAFEEVLRLNPGDNEARKALDTLRSQQ